MKKVELDLEETRRIMEDISQVQTLLEDDYPNWNKQGKEYAIVQSKILLRRAFSQLQKHYGETIYGKK